jgi:hypothetical protein
MNSFFILHKQERADKIIDAIDKHIESYQAQYQVSGLPDELVHLISTYCNDYDINKDGD